MRPILRISLHSSQRTRTNPLLANHQTSRLPSLHPTSISTTPIRSRTTAPASPLHTTLPTFLSHAHRTSLSPTSTVYLGTHYEYTVLHALARLGLSLTRTGGAGDRGIDLRGVWWLPALHNYHGDDAGGGKRKVARRKVRVIVQCKALKGKAGITPSVVRELEGAVAGVSRSWVSSTYTQPIPDTPPSSSTSEEITTSPQTPTSTSTSEGFSATPQPSHAPPPTVALLAAPTAATKGIRDAIARSRHAMGFVKITTDGRVEQMLWNRAAEGAGRGLEGCSVGVRYWNAVVKRDGEDVDEEVAETGLKEGVLQSEVVLIFGGKAWECEEDEVEAWDREEGSGGGHAKA